MERFTCRTCLSVADVDECFLIFKQCLYKNTIKDILLHYIPQMEKSLSENDRICTICLNTIKNFIEFANKCIEIEEQLNYEVENSETDSRSDIEDLQVENIQVVLDKDLKSYFTKDDDTPSTSSSTDNILSIDIVDHDHTYIKPTDLDVKNEVTITGTEEVDQTVEFESDTLKDEDFNDVDNIKLISVSAVADEIMTEDFMEVCNTEDDSNLSQNITVLATGSECIDPTIIQVKEEINESLTESMDGVTYYQPFEDESCIYVCEICEDGFLSETLLKEHYLSHGEIRIMCDKCPKIVKNDSALKAHYKLKHMEVERYKCNLCSQVFARADYLRNHIKRHEEDKNKNNIKCRVPGKFLRFKNTDDPLPCKICGKYYNGIQKLKVHLQTHLVVKRFACEYCDLTYKRWPSLKRHEKTHLEASSIFHRCNVCWKRFYNKDELNFHMSQHGNPRYRCQVCNEQFHRKYLFDNHYLLKHATPEDIENSKKEVIYDTLLELSSQNLLVTE